MPAIVEQRQLDVTIREIPDGQSLKGFIDVAWTMNQGDPNWIPPLRMSISSALNRAKHPFHRHAEVAYFVAERRGRVVGRIAAIVNHLHNEFHEDRIGFFGLFECERNEATSAALFDAAAAWLRDRGMTVMRGPVNLSTNEEVASPGILVEGFDSRPTLMMGHNPAYYGELHERAGFTKVKDLLAFYWDDPSKTPRRGVELLDRILKREGVTIRPLSLKRFRQDVDAIKEVYNAAWSKNWGFVPMTNEEFEHLAKEFRPFVDPNLCLVAEAEGEAVGFGLALPDLNEAIRHIPDGRLFPLGIFKLLWHKRKIRGMRFLTLGFRPKYQHSGLGVGFYARTWQAAADAGYTHGEASWILEDNHEMVRALERIDGRPYRRYRLYDRSL